LWHWSRFINNAVQAFCLNQKKRGRRRRRRRRASTKKVLCT
jgi:hypothetical protein